MSEHFTPAPLLKQEPTATDCAWAAGIIDGEGCVSMTRIKVGVNRRKTPGYQLRVTVRMTCEATVRRLQSIFGGTVSVNRSRSPRKHRKSYQWYASDLRCVGVLQRVSPYMTTKLAQARLGIEYREVCCTEKPRGRGALCCPEVVALRQSYYERFAFLNKKGPR